MTALSDFLNIGKNFFFPFSSSSSTDLIFLLGTNIKTARSLLESGEDDAATALLKQSIDACRGINLINYPEVSGQLKEVGGLLETIGMRAVNRLSRIKNLPSQEVRLEKSIVKTTIDRVCTILESSVHAFVRRGKQASQKHFYFSLYNLRKAIGCELVMQSGAMMYQSMFSLSIDYYATNCSFVEGWKSLKLLMKCDLLWKDYLKKEIIQHKRSDPIGAPHSLSPEKFESCVRHWVQIKMVTAYAENHPSIIALKDRQKMRDLLTRSIQAMRDDFELLGMVCLTEERGTIGKDHLDKRPYSETKLATLEDLKLKISYEALS